MAKEIRSDTRQVVAAGASPLTVKWDDSKMSTAYANVCNVLGTREEITFLFGVNQTWQSGQSEVKLKITDRVVLNPYAAKRLMQMLKKGLSEYESLYGELKV